MTTDVDTMVRTALGRLGDRGVFITVAPAPRTYVDQLLCGIVSCWTGDELEYRIVTSSRVYGLVVAAVPDAAQRVERVATAVLEPYVARASALTH